jgi:hypothetical protein
MSAFIKDRTKFLKTIVEAVNCESTNIDAQNCVKLFEDSPIFRFLPSLIAENNEICENSFLALGNLISSDNKTVAYVAAHTAFNHFKLIKECFNNHETAKAASYIVYALSNLELTIDQKNTLIDLAKIHVKSNTSQIAFEMLEIIKNFGDCYDIPIDLLLKFANLPKVKIQKWALQLISDQVSNNKFDTTYSKKVYDYLRSLILTSNNIIAAFTLANLMTIDNNGDYLFTDNDFLNSITTIMQQNVAAKNIEYCWILLNSFHTVNKSKLNDDTLTKLETALKLFAGKLTLTQFDKMCCNVNETIDKINKLKNSRIPLTDDILDMEVDEDASVSQTNLYYPPHAYELCKKYFPPVATSKTVYDLIQRLKESETLYVDIPKTTQFNVDDLNNLADLGYEIENGRLEIPEYIAGFNTVE